jgi:hypothetical protein
MKKVFFIFIVLICSVSYSQNDTYNFNHHGSFAIATGYKTFFGNNFLARTYLNNPVIAFDFNCKIYKDYGAGLFFSKHSASIKTTQYIGNSVSGDFLNWGFYVCYYKQINQKWGVVPKVGIATFRLINKLYDGYSNYSYPYYTSGSSYFVAPEINYFVNKSISCFVKPEYDYIDLTDLRASSSLDTDYNTAHQFEVQVGIRLWF